jgi:Tfp pilus assembly protein PilF
MNESAALERASALCDLQRWDEAVAHLRALLATDPHSERALRQMARAQLGRRDYDQALRWSHAAIAENPENEWAHRLGALALGGLGRHPEACAMAREALRLAPLTWQGHWVLAEALVKSGTGLDEARAAADRAVELAPHAPESHCAVGVVAAADGRTSQAVAAFGRALAIDPENAPAHNELGRLTLGRSMTKRWTLFGSAGGLARAADAFATAARLDPRSQWAARNLDVVMDAAIGRQTVVILLIAWIAWAVHRSSDAAPARVLPALLLGFPAFFAVRFGSMLSTAVRDYLRRYVRRRPIAVVVTADAIAVSALVAGAAFPRITTIAFGSAVACAILARLVMWERNRRRAAAQLGRRRIRASALRLVQEVMVLLVIAALAADLGPAGPDGPFGPVAFLAMVVVVLLSRRKG